MSIEFKYSDFDIDMNKNEFTDDVAVKRDRNSIQQAILNILLTKKGEKPFNRDFGVGLRDYIFKNFGYTDLMLLKSDIDLAFERDGRMELEELALDDSQIDANYISLKLTYIIFLKDEQERKDLQTLTIGLTKVR